MTLKWNLILFNIICLVNINSYIKDPSYSPDYFFSTFNRNNDVSFLDRRRRNKISTRRVQLLDKILANSSVFVDGILHYSINDKHKHSKQVYAIEKAFRDLIGMRAVEYAYKRDPFWRTWRRVKYPEGDQIVCYRCQNSVNCTNCQYGAYWVIEENPPTCPYEVVSVINNEELCAMNLTNATNSDERVVLFSDLSKSCDNPIETKWRVYKIFDKTVSERFPTIICGARAFCELSTIYTLTRDYVSFRIINSTNNIIYSRVMKNGKKNYACVEDCGTLDPATKVVSKTDGPLTVDMINNKNKRHDKTQIDSTDSYKTSTTSTKEDNLLEKEEFNQAFNNMETAFNFFNSKNGNDQKKQNPKLGHDHKRQNSKLGHDQKQKNSGHTHHRHHEKHLSCSSLKHLDNASDDD